MAPKMEEDRAQAFPHKSESFVLGNPDLWRKIESARTPRWMTHVGPSPVGEMESERFIFLRSLRTPFLRRKAWLQPAVLTARTPIPCPLTQAHHTPSQQKASYKTPDSFSAALSFLLLGTPSSSTLNKALPFSLSGSCDLVLY